MPGIKHALSSSLVTPAHYLAIEWKNFIKEPQNKEEEETLKVLVWGWLKPSFKKGLDDIIIIQKLKITGVF